MKRIQNIMVGLDLNPLDELLLSTAKHFGKALESQKVTGIHIIPAILIGETIKVESRHVLRPIAPAVGKIEEEIAHKTEKWMASTGMKFDTKVFEGKPYTEILKLVEMHHADLFIIGKKKDPLTKRVSAKKITRHVGCDLLIMPEDSFPLVEKIIVPIDFSKNSIKALERALYLNEHFKTEPAIECVFVLRDPFFKRTVVADSNLLSPEELPLDLKVKLSNFKADHAVLLEKVKITLLEDTKDSIAGTLKEYAEANDSDLIVMGAQGKNLTERLVFGSVAEEIVDEYFEKAVYIVR